MHSRWALLAFVTTTLLLLPSQLISQPAPCEPTGVREALTKEQFSKLLIQAESGDLQAQLRVGVAFEFGTGVQQDYAQAAHWYLRAAERGHWGAQINLSFLYWEGRGVPKDRDRALAWDQKAMAAMHKEADQGNAEAQFNLGKAYAEGRTMPPNHIEAAKWFRKAAEQNLCGALTALGNIFSRGEGVPVNDAEAVSWYRRAAEGGDPEGQNQLGFMYSEGRGVPKDLAQTVTWFRRAADQGFRGAQFNLGRSYYLGIGLAENHVEAAKWFRKAAEQGDDMAQYCLGGQYLRGDGVPEDRDEALRWLHKSAEQDNSDALVLLAEIEAESKPLPSGDIHVHQTGETSLRQAPVRLADMDRQLAELAHEYESYPVTRAAIFDVALPRDAEEYLALNKQAILLVSAVTQDATELPLRRVFMRDSINREIELTKLADFRSETEPGSEMRAVLGPFKLHAFYFLPVLFYLQDAELFVDFAKNRQDFPIGRSERISPDCLPKGEQDHSPKPGVQVPSAVVERILEREFDVALPSSKAQDAGSRR